MKHQKLVLTGAALMAAAVVGLASAGVVSAASGTPADSASIVDKIASKFNLNKQEVQAVFDADREEHRAAMETERQQRLAQAVADGAITQEQADHITKAHQEIKALMGDTRPNDQAESTRRQIHDKMVALRQWAEDNNIELRDVMGGPGGHSGPGRGFDEPHNAIRAL